MANGLKAVKPVRKTDTLRDRVGDRLREAIMGGHFSPGEKLTIRAVAAALNVSLTPIREALYNLVAEGVLELREDGSVYLPTVTEERVRELTQIRCALEGLAAHEAAGRISDADIGRAERIHERLSEANDRKDFATLIDLNWEFHFLIYGASGMPHLVRMIQGCWLTTGSYLKLIYPKYGDIRGGIRQHELILAALKERDSKRLSRLLREDIKLASDALLATISEDHNQPKATPLRRRSP